MRPKAGPLELLYHWGAGGRKAGNAGCRLKKPKTAALKSPLRRAAQKWSAPGRTISSAPGMAAAMARLWEGLIMSFSPVITRQGEWILASFSKAKLGWWTISPRISLRLRALRSKKAAREHRE